MTTPRTTMNGKPVHMVPAKTIINFDSDFGPKLLCDGLTFSTDLSCAFSCDFCYVPSMMTKSPQFAAVREQGLKFEDVVMRRKDWEIVMRAQLMSHRGSKAGKHPYSPDDHRVIYSSPLADVAGNMEMVRDTITACRMILELTGWHIRLLSKSNLLPQVAKGLGHEFDAPQRVIYGVSTGTLDDDLAAAFEKGTARVSKRIESLYWLQDHGFRTFGMICPSLPIPGASYIQFSKQMREALRADNLEHIWAEVINVRGDSMTRTIAALTSAGYDGHALLLKRVCEDREQWEDYSRRTFEGHRQIFPPEKLRFLQYVNKRNRDWWSARAGEGAVLLGTAAHSQGAALASVPSQAKPAYPADLYEQTFPLPASA